jgi:hypothetical protein
MELKNEKLLALVKQHGESETARFAETYLAMRKRQRDRTSERSAKLERLEKAIRDGKISEEELWRD